MAGGEIVILLLGPTLSGKTTFVRCASGQPSTQGRVTTIECEEHIVNAHDTVFRIIDTPGFDDSPTTNLATLKKISQKLYNLKPQEVSGVIYFHRITNTRLTGAARSNINVFERICGKAFLRQC
ncbi:hypothetical protein OQA88_9471 [Cercophora sp. LCS_1]